MFDCIRCSKNDDYSSDASFDLRTLYIRCGYAMNEFNVPFTKAEEGHFTLRICKSCRASFLKTIERWFNDKRIGNYKYKIKTEAIKENK